MSRFWMFLAISGFLSACKEKEPAGQLPAKPGHVEKALSGKTPTKFYYLEFVDLDSSETSRGSIQMVKEDLLYHGIYYTLKPRGQDHLQGARLNDSIDLSIVDPHFPYICRFVPIVDYDPKDKDAVRLVITYNKAIGDTLPNFNIRGYEKLGHAKWQSRFNPGNFRYHHTPRECPDKEVSMWMTETIYKVVFK